MFAIVETGGRQYKVSLQDIIEVNKLEADAEGRITFDRILLVADGEDVKVGQPYLEKATVEARVIEQTKGSKVIAFNFRRRKDSKKKIGHRQRLTRLQIEKINA